MIKMIFKIDIIYMNKLFLMFFSIHDDVTADVR
jgi:hypothetical protein